MIQQTLDELFERDLIRLSNEIKAFDHEGDLWLINGTIKNSAGNLCMHLIGNLNHFVAHVLGDTDYIRQREHEFKGKESRAILLNQIEETKEVVSKAILNLSDADLNNMFPIRVFEKDQSNMHFLMHLSTHLNYHLGQINYHRRLLPPSNHLH